MELWAAFFLGLAGSLHCAGMCGPLALAAPGAKGKPLAVVLGRVAYNVGRVVTYCLLGAAFGLAGRTLTLIGIGRWLSLGAGMAILIVLAVSGRGRFNPWLARVASWVRSPLGSLLSRRGLTAGFLLGACNGLLPCGLVYAACASAGATGGLLPGAGHMLMFGLGTIPMMLAIGVFGVKLQLALRLRFQKLIPIGLVALSVLLILRGALSGPSTAGPANRPHCPLCR